MEGILSANTTSRMESSANGMTFYGKVISLFFGVLFIVIEIFARKVRLKPLLNTLPDQNFQAQEVKPDTPTATFYLVAAAIPACTCSWIVSNREAQAFVLRKIRRSMPNNTVAPTRTITDSHRMINLRLQTS